MTTVYALIEEGKGIKYIGKTSKTTSYRLNEHIRDSKCRNAKRHVWMRSMTARGLTPRILELEQCEGDGDAEEIFHIALARKDGIDLVNLTEGGRSNKKTPECREKMSIAAKTSPKAIAARKAVSHIRVQQMADARRGKKQPQSVIDARMESRRKNGWTPKGEAKERWLAGAKRGGEWWKGKTRSKDHMAKLAAGAKAFHTGRKQSPEVIAKRVAGIKLAAIVRAALSVKD